MESTFLCMFRFMQELDSNLIADPSGRAVKGVGLRPSACWVCGFEARRGHGYLSHV
jgi:hypothetical protein